MKIVLIVLCLSFSTHAAQSIKVLGLFNGKAYLNIDGNNKLLADGESFNGITLIQATARWAKIKDSNGLIRQVSTGGAVTNSYKKPQRTSLKIYPNSKGMYEVNGHINNSPISFLIDTGATYVAMSERHAKKIGIDYKRKGIKSLATTASGTVATWEVTLDAVDIGGIKVNFVPAAVISGDHPYQVLLGMSYLKNIKVEQDGNTMVLQKKY